ncbi:MAG: transporter substrate-binding domain-containing protein [Pseudomonadota bacterium]
MNLFKLYNRSFSALIALLFILFSVFTHRIAHAATTDTQVIQVGSEVEFPPFAIVDQNGQAAGFSVDLIKAVANAMGLQIVITTGPWDTMWNGLVSGQLDVLPIVAASPERKSLIDFSLPHTETFDAFFVRDGSPAIKNIAGAQGKQIVVMLSDASHHALLKQKFKGEIITVETIPAGLSLIASGKHDAFLCSKLIGTMAISSHGIKGLRAGPVIPDYKRIFSFGVKKGSQELMDKLNEGLLIVKTNGEYARIYEKWLSFDDPWFKYRKYALFIFYAFLTAIALTIISWIVMLKMQVERRTAELKKANVALANDITKRSQMEVEQRAALYDLAERVKELNCLYGLGQLIEKPGITIEGICGGLLTLIPASFQYPEITCAKIRLQEREYKTPNFKETTWRMDSPIEVDGKQYGELYVYYLEEKPECDEGPFLKEERLLINAVAERLGKNIQRTLLGKALHESEKLYRSLFENLLNGFVYCRMLFEDGKPRDFIYLAVNYAFELQTGLKDVVGRRVSEVIPGIQEADPQLFENYGRVAMTGQTERFEIFIESMQQWFLISVYRTAPEHLVAVFDNITERKLIETTLKESVQRFRSYFELPLIGNAITSLEKGWLEYNDRICEIFGYARDELRQKTWTQMTHPDDLAADMEKFNLILSNKIDNYKIEKRFIRRNGSIVHTNLAVGCVRKPDRSIDYFIAIVDDITERKRLEDDLRQSEERYRTVANYAYDWETWINPENKYEYCSPSCERITGYTADDFIKNPQLLNNIIHPDDKTSVGSHFTAITNAPNEINLEFKIITKNGDARYVNHICQSIFNSKGAFIGRRGSNRDITEKKQLEEELIRTKKFDAMSIFSAGIAHDFNNLMTGILGYITLSKDINTTQEKTFRFLEEAEKLILKTRDLTGNFLVLSGSGLEYSNTTEPCKLIKDAVRLSLRDSNVKCEFKLPEKAWEIKCASSLLRQIIFIVVKNSREAMSNGGVVKINAGHIVYNEGEKRLPLKGGPYFFISFSDTGCGIAEENLPKIFDPYYSSKKKGVQKGVGLGLAVVYSIVTRLNGYIHVESKEDRGTEVFIYLPSTGKPAVKDEKKEAAEITEVGTTPGIKRILVMDDEESIRTTVKLLLEQVGYDVDEAENGEEALRKYAQAKDSSNPFDAVILDLSIVGGMGGVETIKNLLEIDPQVKGIVFSGYSVDPAIFNYKNYGFKGALAKPAARAQIIEALKKAC